MIQINRTSILPLYYQLAQNLRKQIHSGELPPGSCLPSERDLMVEYRLSRNTVRHAMEVLDHEGLIVRDHGHGTFVSQLSDRFEYKLETFYENWDLLERAGYTPSVKYLETCRVYPPETVRTALQMNADQRTTCHTLVFYGDDHPAMFTRDYLLTESDEEFDISKSGEGFLNYLERTSGSRVEYVLADLQAVEATPEIAATFQCAEGTPVMLYQELFLDGSQSVPIAYSLNYFNQQIVQFRLLTRRG